MPELADVEGYRRRLSNHGRGRRIAAVEVGDAGVLRNTTSRGLSRALRSRRLEEPERRGKYLLAHTDGPTLLLHFGMTGELSWSNSRDDRHRHDRVVLVLDGEGELRYRDQRKLQGIWLATGGADEARATVGDQGPDAGGLGRHELEERVGASRAQLKPTLMDQRVVAGLGNLLTDEILWQARLHPQQQAAGLSPEQWRRLHRSLTRVLRTSVDQGRVPPRPSWLTGARDSSEAPCPRCSSRLRRIRVGGRTTVICPRCQPTPRQRGGRRHDRPTRRTDDRDRR
ncbi:MAG TPA: DNA-formamidopyrimidine glycosylase family protein [Acidimicrobiales bacterium]|nr:DNA-formamidopyrimidine glycosylase family protein [Acidimicrobiales bacterium]